MMAGVVRSREAERLARCRREMELALALGVSIHEARQRISHEQWDAQRLRFEARAADRLERVASNASASGGAPRPWMMAE